MPPRPSSRVPRRRTPRPPRSSSRRPAPPLPSSKFSYWVTRNAHLQGSDLQVRPLFACGCPSRPRGAVRCPEKRTYGTSGVPRARFSGHQSQAACRGLNYQDIAEGDCSPNKHQGLRQSPNPHDDGPWMDVLVEKNIHPRTVELENTLHFRHDLLADLRQHPRQWRADTSGHHANRWGRRELSIKTRVATSQSQCNVS